MSGNKTTDCWLTKKQRNDTTSTAGTIVSTACVCVPELQTGRGQRSEVRQGELRGQTGGTQRSALPVDTTAITPDCQFRMEQMAKNCIATNYGRSKLKENSCVYQIATLIVPVKIELCHPFNTHQSWVVNGTAFVL